MKKGRIEDPVSPVEQASYRLGNADEASTLDNQLRANEDAPAKDFIASGLQECLEKLVSLGFERPNEVESQVEYHAPAAYLARLWRRYKATEAALDAGDADSLFYAAARLGHLQAEIEMRRAALPKARKADAFKSGRKGPRKGTKLLIERIRALAGEHDITQQRGWRQELAHLVWESELKEEFESWESVYNFCTRERVFGNSREPSETSVGPR